MDLSSAKIGFLGGGNIAKAIGGGLIKSGIVKPINVFVYAPSERSFPHWNALQAHFTSDMGKMVATVDIVFLCMKPYQFDEAMKKLKNETKCSIEGKLVVSTLSGTPLSTLYFKLNDVIKGVRLIRSMPNTPVMVGEGCTVLTPHDTACKSDVEIVRKIFMSVGRCEIVPEHLISSVIGVAGSSPAFIYVLIEAMADAGVKGGLTRELAQTLSAQAVMGAAKMVLESGQHPGQLKDAVCSPGGTTIAGIAALEKAGLRSAIMSAVEASTLRSDEMARLYK